MATPILAGLSAIGRAALPIIRGGVSRGLSSRAINQLIKEAFGTGIRRQTLLDVMREVSGINRTATQLRNLGRFRLPNPARLPPAITRIRRNYSFVVRVTGRLIDTAELITQNITVSLDTVRTREEIERLAEQAVLDNQSTYGMEDISSLIISGVRSGRLGTLSNPVFP